ncbi:cysteine-rich receptor-like protein kinase 10 [Glycine max]|uniref:cysteine-rich receptor-like protein kinase 10 n=2 Tax=Glycine subgen. Soja TaxID=1462606 RepID=UPI001B355328|nr:cysteine-rich receptor-like protein kinase 10 [Glycine max]
MCFENIPLKSKAPVKEDEVEDEIKIAESLQFNFNTIQVATEDFSDSNKLGQGGFGVVYRGRLSNGQMIAVKKLSRDSCQGDTKFKNEVLLVAKLQLRNLVRLLGFCLEGNERLLVYEYVPNKSLDYFTFDPNMKAQLDWESRYNIFSCGVLVLEILSGQKDSGIHHGENVEDLLSFAWRSWNEQTAINIVDPSLNNNSRNEMMRCIHIGLLCVQENLVDRPTTATIMLMNANNVTPTKDNTQLLRI